LKAFIYRNQLEKYNFTKDIRNRLNCFFLHKKSMIDFFEEMQRNYKTNLKMEEILKINRGNLKIQDLDNSEERALPSDKKLHESGWWKMMFARYGVAQKFSKGKVVLDSCCGLGWGSYLVSVKAKRVFSFDKDTEAIKFAKRTWVSKNLNYSVGDALEAGFKDNSFDIVLAMETLEHFDIYNGNRYIEEINRVLKKGGHFIASTYFAPDRESAVKVCKTNKFHLHIYTKKEIEETLYKYFRKVYFLEDLFFISRK